MTPANSTFSLSNTAPIVTLPRNRPGLPATAGIVNDLRGCFAATTPVCTSRLSESVTPHTVTLVWAARRESFTVTSTVSLHS